MSKAYLARRIQTQASLLTCLSTFQELDLFPPPFQISILICLLVKASLRKALAAATLRLTEGRPFLLPLAPLLELELPPQYLMMDRVLKTEVATRIASSPCAV